MKEKLKIINKYKIKEKEYYENLFNQNFFFTVSELKEIFDIIEEMYIIENQKDIDELKKFQIKNEKSKKENSSEFLKYIKKLRFPIKTKNIENVKSKINKLKSKEMKINYSQNFEGEGLQIELNIKNEIDFQNVLKKLNNNEKEILELIRIVNRGE